ncbi:MAG: PAS domain S-box protein, partial [Ignavibacteriales bacterium]|nr:PAS domain S-box protein [Ignavibacteriales bacterium]
MFPSSQSSARSKVNTYKKKPTAGEKKSAAGTKQVQHVPLSHEQVDIQKRLHFYTHALESISEIVTITDLDDKFIFVNKAFREQYHYTDEEIIGKHVAILRSKRFSATEGTTILAESRKDGWKGEVFNQSKDGKEFRIALSTSTIRDEQGNILGLIGIAEDITESKKASEKLRWLGSIVESSQDAIISKNMDGIILSWNKGAERLYGYTAEEVIGKPINILFPLEFREEFLHITRLLRLGEKFEHYETKRIRKDGERISVSLAVSPIKNERGEIIGASSIARDITERKSAEEKLKKSETKFRTVAESLGEGLLITDLDDVILFMNSRLEEMTGYSTTHLLRRKAYEFLLPPNEWSVLKMRHVRRAQGVSERYEIQLRKKDGSLLWTEINATPYKDASGKIIGTLGAITDITERKQAEDQIRKINADLERRVSERTAEVVAQKDKLAQINEELNKLIRQLEDAKAKAEEASQTKSRFLMNISHELRTPLNSVIGFANVLLKNKNANLVAQDVLYLERILDNGKHLLNVINQILDLSRVEAGKIEIELSLISLESLISETITDLQIQVQQKEINIESEIPSPLARIETDRNKLKQILLNLLANALKFTDRGTIKVQVERDPADLKPNCINVIDTGIGIPSHLLDEIFEAFKQADNTTTRKYEGTGIGLAIARSL